MSKRGKPGRHRWIISEWLDADSDDFWPTLIAVVGWILLLIVVLGWPQ